MPRETQVYRRLGPHPRLVKIIDFNADEFVITMEYVENERLDEYLAKYGEEISEEQRRKWVR